MAVHTLNPIAAGGVGRQEEKKFKVSFGFIVSLRLYLKKSKAYN